jgi:hypothetical protein
MGSHRWQPLHRSAVYAAPQINLLTHWFPSIMIITNSELSLTSGLHRQPSQSACPQHQDAFISTPTLPTVENPHFTTSRQILPPW